MYLLVEKPPPGHEKWNSFFAFFFVCLIAIFSVAEVVSFAQDSFSLQNLLEVRVSGCKSLLELPHFKRDGAEIVLKALKQSAQAFSLPEDKIIVSLAKSSDTLSLSALTQTGQREAKLIVNNNVSRVRLAGVLIGSNPANERQAKNILMSQGHFSIADFICARDRKQWDEAIRIFEQDLSDADKSLEFIQQQLAFVLNRRNQENDREKAEIILKRLIDFGSQDGETYGLLARIHKDKYMALVAQNAEAHLIHTQLTTAIELYKKGFELDPTNYYPAIAMIELSLELGTEHALKEAIALAPVIQFMLNRSTTNYEPDYWKLASSLSLASVEKNWQKAEHYYQQMIALPCAPWMLETTFQGQDRVLRLFKKILSEGSTLVNEQDIDHLQLLNQRLETLIEARENHGGALIFTGSETHQTDSYRPRVNIETSRVQSITHGIISTIDTDVAEEAAKIGVGFDFNRLKANAKNTLSIQDFLRSFYHAPTPSQNPSQTLGFLLGMTKAEHRPTYQAISRLTHLESWWETYSQLGLTGKEPDHTKTYMQSITEADKPVVFLVPRNLFHSTIDVSFTAKEMEWILENPEKRAKNVTFVFGAYQMIQAGFVQDVLRRNGDAASVDIMTTILKGWQNFLLSP